MFAERLRPWGSEVIGCTLLGALAGWVWLSAELRGGDPAEILQTLAILGGVYVLGRLTAGWAWIVAAAAVGAFGWWVLTQPGSLEGGPLAEPLGYANANAALAIQVGGIALVAAVRTRSRVLRWVLVLGAVTAMAVAIPNDSRAAIAVGLVLFGVALYTIVMVPRTSWKWLVASFGVVVTAIIGQVLIATGPKSESWVSERRVSLWSDAVDLARSEPLFGHGPESFATASATAASDPDTQATHSVVLEMAAEVGFVGAALLLVLFAWTFVSLASAANVSAAIVGGVAWAAFALQSLIDYVADFPMVVAAAGLSLGLARGSMRQNSSMSPRVNDQSLAGGG